MRFPLLMLATTLFGLACAKDPALSSTTTKLEPEALNPSRLTNDKAALGSSASGSASPGASVALNPGEGPASRASAGNSSAANLPVAQASPSNMSAGDSSARKASAATAPVPSSIAEEGNAEPMDDVDDEAAPATDKSGAARADLKAGTDSDEGRAGRFDDDSEGADIDIRQ